MPPPPPAPSRFWARQFKSPQTARQRSFDALAGIVLPILCLAFDPFVLTDMFAQARVFLTLGAGVCVATLVVWLGLRPLRGDRWRGFAGTVFLIGAILSFGIGIAILPFTLLGLLFSAMVHSADLLISVLGFVPLLTAFSYLRNGWLALRLFEQPSQQRQFGVGIAAGLVTTLVLPIIVQEKATQYVEQKLQSILQADRSAAQDGVSALQRAFWCTDSSYEPLITHYLANPDTSRRMVLDDAYRQLTGITIDEAMDQRRD